MFLTFDCFLFGSISMLRLGFHLTPRRSYKLCRGRDRQLPRIEPIAGMVTAIVRKLCNLMMLQIDFENL